MQITSVSVKFSKDNYLDFTYDLILYKTYYLIDCVQWVVGVSCGRSTQNIEFQSVRSVCDQGYTLKTKENKNLRKQFYVFIMIENKIKTRVPYREQGSAWQHLRR